MPLLFTAVLVSPCWDTQTSHAASIFTLPWSPVSISLCWSSYHSFPNFPTSSWLTTRKAQTLSGALLRQMSSTEYIIHSTSVDNVSFFITALTNPMVRQGSVPTCSPQSLHPAWLSPPSLCCDWQPPQLPPCESGLTVRAPTQEHGNTSQRSAIMLNFNKVLLLQMKTIPFQYWPLLCWQACLHTCMEWTPTGNCSS